MSTSSKVLLSATKMNLARMKAHEIAQHTGLSRSTVRRIVQEDMNFQNFRRQKAQLFSESSREQRRQRAQILLKRFPPHTVRRI